MATDPETTSKNASSSSDSMTVGGGAMTAVAAITLLLVLGAYFGGVWSGAAPRDAFLASLAVMTVWVVLASPALAMGGAVHGPAGASVVCLVVLCFASRYLTAESAARIACILAATSIMSASAVRCAKTRTGKWVMVAVISVGMMLALATPFWTGSLLQSLGAGRPVLVAGAVYANPFLCVSAAVVEQTRFVWHSSGYLYDWSTLRDAAPPAMLWFPWPLICLAVTAAFEMIHFFRRSRRPPESH